MKKTNKVIPINKINRKRNISKKDKRNQMLTLGVIILGIFIGLMLVFKPNAYKITVNAKELGVVEGENVPQQSLNTVLASLEDKYKTDVKLASEVDIQKVYSSKKNLVTSDYLISQMRENLNYKIKMTELFIDGKSWGVFPGEKEANDLIDKIKAKYTPEDLEGNLESKLKADLKLKDVYKEEDSLSDPDKLYQELTKTVEEEKIYKLIAGDTIWGIASKHEMSLEELLALNPDLTEESVLQIDQEIKVKIDKPVVSVEVIEEYKETEEFALEPVIKTNPDKYVTYKEVMSPAKAGVKETTINNVYIDARLVETRTKDTKVLEEGAAQVIMVGTKPLPPKAATGKFQMPTTGRLTSGFGPRWGRNHNGIDLANSVGTPLYAADGGTVKRAAWDSSGYGNLVVIDHGNGFETYYGHASEILVNSGQKVGKGEKIALMGSTGRSTGSHLHFEIRKNGKPVNPYDYI